MKKIFSIILFSLLSGTMYAQLDSSTSTLTINGYTENAAISLIKNNKLRVQNKEISDTFNLLKKGTHLGLETSNDSAKFLSILNLDYNLLKSTLSPVTGGSVIDSLIDLTATMKGQKLILAAGDSIESATEISGDEKSEVPKTENDYKFWLFPLLIGIGGLGLGFLLGKGSKKNQPKSIPAEPAIQSPATSEIFKEAVVNPSDTEKELKKELKDLKEKNNLLSSKTKELIEGDQAFYTATFEKIILPLQKALDDGNAVDVVKYSNLAMVYLSSITRVKIRKKQNYDDANIQLLLGNNSFTKDFPEIDFQTSLDKIPANLRVLMDILEANGVKSLGDVIIKGYKIKGQ
ncbi:MAG TPA: hypothetical protein PKX92_07650 [Edaphocola sp.]|nr:hypothetical protein [Edaphocola sp.]